MFKGINIDDLGIEEIELYIDNKGNDEVPEEYAQYLSVMEAIRGWLNRAIPEDIIRTKLRRPPYEIKNEKLLKKLINDTINYFYSDAEISKESLRKMYGMTLYKIAYQMLLSAKSVRDLKDAASVFKDSAEMRGVKEDDLDDLPEELRMRPFKIYTTNPEDLGLPKADRRILAKQIDDFADLTEFQKDKIKREAGVLPFKLELPKYEEEPTKG